MKELETLQNRRYTLGFFNGIPDDSAQDYNDTSSKSDYRNCGFVREIFEDYVIFELRHKISKGDEIEFLSPYRFEPYKIKIGDIQIANSKKTVDTLSPGQLNIAAKISVDKKDIGLFPKYTIARIKIK